VSRAGLSLRLVSGDQISSYAWEDAIMNKVKELGSRQPTQPEPQPDLLEQYGCGPIRFTGTDDALYERHLLFDDVIDPVDAGARERFEAVAQGYAVPTLGADRARLPSGEPETRLLLVDGISHWALTQ
jgi:hypothetical protein